VRIAIMDATENDAPSPYKASGFPTIHFFPADRDVAGIEYDQGRTSLDVVEFIMSNAAIKFEFDTSKLPDPESEAEVEEEEEGGEEEAEAAEGAFEEGLAVDSDDDVGDADAGKDDL
jgi:hypothetical protein